MVDRNLEYEEQIRSIVEEHPGGTWPRIILAKKNKHLLDYINGRTPLLQNPKYTLATKIYWTLNDLHDFPLCQNEHCHRPLVNQNVNVLKGYTRPFCNLKCSCGSEKSRLKAKQTTLERYGDPNYRNREKARQTYIEHYGVDNNMKSEKGKAEYNAAIQEKYGADWLTQTKHFHDKAVKTWMENYGVDNPTKSKEVVEGIQNRFLEKHGVKSPMQLKEVQEKQKQICLDKYGVEYLFQAFAIKEKTRETILKKYGVRHIMQLDEIRKKRDETCLAKYGTIYPIQTYEVKEKLKKSLKAWHETHTRPFRTLYKYDGKRFDSSWELFFYVWLKDHGVDFQYQPKQIINYVFEGNDHCYHPDFLVENYLVEIKGDQFFKEDGTMCCPWRHPSWSDEDKKKVDALYEAKRQCMESNGVTILRGNDLLPVFEYIEEKYGQDYFTKFKTTKGTTRK